MLIYRDLARKETQANVENVCIDGTSYICGYSTLGGFSSPHSVRFQTQCALIRVNVPTSFFFLRDIRCV